MTTGIWTTERLFTLRKLILDHTASGCARCLGCSRNSIIGACHRYGIKLESRDRWSGKPIPKKEPRTPNPNAGHHGPLSIKFKKTFIPMPRETYIACKPIKFPDPRFMANGYCRNIIGEPVNLECCGLPTSEGHVYCIEHERLFYKTEDRK